MLQDAIGMRSHKSESEAQICVVLHKNGNFAH